MNYTSLYFHWPFCELKCPYCDFNSHVRERVDNSKWLTAYLKEIDFYSDYLKQKEIRTIYFGGGTPSLMTPEMIEKITSKIKSNFNVIENAEITIEGNPASSEIEKFRGFKQAGINRLSIGIQSFDDERLKFLGRKHNRLEAIKAIEAAQKVFDNFSIDLIYATQNQTEKSWAEELDFALKFGSPHISLYQLTIEKGTEFYSQTKKGETKTAQDELAENLYFQTVERLAKEGLERYEISNFAKRSFESKHNLNYWNYGEYLGIGAGAHSRISTSRHCERTMVSEAISGDNGTRLPRSLKLARNDRETKRTAIFDIHNPENWLEAVLKTGNGIQKQNPLSKQQMLEEMLYMGLRIRDGINLDNFEKILGKKFFEIFDTEKLQIFIDEGFIEILPIKALTSNPLPQAGEEVLVSKKLLGFELNKAGEGKTSSSTPNLKSTNKGIMLHSALTKKLIKIAETV